MPTFPPSLNVSLPARLTVRSSRAEITAELVTVNRARDEFGVPRNDFQMLYDLFPPGAAGKYDLCHFGSLQRAQLLADQIPIDLHVTSLLDIGSGTGNTLIRVVQTLHARTILRHIAFVDGHGEMIKRLMEKFEDEVPDQRKLGRGFMAQSAVQAYSARQDDLVAEQDIYTALERFAEQFWPVIGCQLDSTYMESQIGPVIIPCLLSHNILW